MPLYTYTGLAPSCYTGLTGSSHDDLLVLHLQNRMKLNPGISRILAQRRKLGFEEELVHGAAMADDFADLQFTILGKGRPYSSSVW